MRTFLLRLTNTNQEWLSDLTDEELTVHINAILSMSKRVMESMTPAQVSPEIKTELEVIKGMLTVAMPKVLQTQHNSSVKGDEGEKSADALILNNFPHIKIEDTSAGARGGDRRLTIEDANVMLEFKHYKNTVPTKEIEKFLRDLNDSRCTIGILCSITSAIAKKPRNISFEKCGSAVCVYIPFSGESHTKLLAIISWAEWYIRSKIKLFDPKENMTILELSLEALSEVDELNRQLETSIDQMNKSIAQLTSARHMSIATLKSRLSMIHTLLNN